MQCAYSDSFLLPISVYYFFRYPQKSVYFYHSHMFLIHFMYPPIHNKSRFLYHSVFYLISFQFSFLHFHNAGVKCTSVPCSVCILFSFILIPIYIFHSKRKTKTKIIFFHLFSFSSFCRVFLMLHMYILDSFTFIHSFWFFFQFMLRFKNSFG